MTGRGRVIAIERIGFTVADLARSEGFYSGLGFVRVALEPVGADDLALLGLPQARAERLTMKLGRQEVDFLRFDPPGRPYPPGSTATDLWFQHIAIVVGDMGKAYRRLAESRFTPITEDGPQHLPENTGGVTAFKFRDPDGHPLELLHLPAVTPDASWKVRHPAAPFLCIDHTAIAVGDVARSRQFYGGLGLKPASHSLNRGPEQRRLDDVAKDVVDVVALEPEQKTPHLELLGYRTGARRPMPPGMRADDIAATRTILRVENPAEARADRAMTPDPERRAVLLRDPDGHALVVESG